ncbi:MAG: hypothetical protein H6993_07445 [Pseudomonadales bacterium]|nr:hypothetical protein [Pseudomonadales bacterium]MCP5183780.1 hypothetical protein [Pseudomonadales bacterium]
MLDLLGKSFRLSGHDYVIVDVVDVRGEWMVYAETRQPAQGSIRAAFHLSDLHRLGEFAPTLQSA